MERDMLRDQDGQPLGPITHAGPTFDQLLFGSIETSPAVATECLVCSHVEAPAADPHRCAHCGQIGSDVRVFPVDVAE